MQQIFVSDCLFHFYEMQKDSLIFQTKSGQLAVKRQNDLLAMDFPTYQLKPVTVTDEIATAIGVRPLEVWLGRDLVCVLENEGQVYDAIPNQDKTRALDGLLCHITAPSARYDCVSRSFAPKLNIAEDPICGSAIATSYPFGQTN